MISVSWKTASVTAGSTMWCQPLAVRRPVVHQPICTVSPRPKLGNQPRPTANTRISRMPIRKVGSDTPSSEIVTNTWLRKVPRRSAEYTPMGMPISSAIKAATRPPAPAWPESVQQSGARPCAPWRRLRPNSPWAQTRKCQNCTMKGRSRPRSARSLRDLRGRCVLAQQEHHRVAHILEQHEGDQGDHDHHDHGLYQAAQNKGKHRLRSQGVSGRC